MVSYFLVWPVRWWRRRVPRHGLDRAARIGLHLALDDDLLAAIEAAEDGPGAATHAPQLDRTRRDLAVLAHDQHRSASRDSCTARCGSVISLSALAWA